MNVKNILIDKFNQLKTRHNTAKVFFLAFFLSLVVSFFASAQLTSAAPVATTWQATYYNNMTLSGSPVLTRTESAIDNDWGIGSPDNAINADEFSARYTGTIDIPAGTYRFTASSDDGLRVYVDGELVIDQWVVRLATENIIEVPLTAGEHTVVMEYFDRWWVSSAKLSIIDVPFSMSVSANEPGVKIVVNGTSRDIPYNLESESGASHTVYAPSPQTTSDGRTVQFVGWSDGGAQEHIIIGTPGQTVTAAYEVVSANSIFDNGFEEGDTSAYPQPNIDIRQGNTLEVTNEHPRTGSYSLRMSTGGIEPTSVLDALFTKRNTIYTKTFVSFPADYTLESGAVQNLMVLKTEDFRNGIWVTLGSDYRLSPVYFNDEGQATYPGGFGPEIPRDGSWHEIQTRYTVDTEHGQVEVWLDGQKIAHFTDVNTGQAGRDDIGVLTLGSYFSTVSNNHAMYFDDVEISQAYMANSIEGFQTTVVARNLFLPTQAVYAPDGRIFIAQKDGTIRVVKDGELLETPLVTIPNVNTYQDRGLNSIAIDPNFATNGYIYAAYTYDVNPDDFTGPKTSRVVRLTVTGDTASMSTQQILLGSQVGTVATPSCDSYPANTDCLPSDARTHSVGQLQFMEDGTLLFSHGEGASDLTVNTQALRAQSLTSLGGKLLRINTDGTGVASNPFYTGNPNDNQSKVYAYGLRNTFRYSVKPGTNIVYAGDVGWGTWEEINVIRPGQNYGWPCFEGEQFLLGYSIYGTCQALNTLGTAQGPLHVYPHPPSSASVGGGFYTGTDYPEKYQGAYFFGDYARNTISTLRTNPDDTLIPGSVEVLTESADGPVQIFIGPDGNLNYLSINTGQLRKIEYIRNGFRPVAQAAANPTSGALPLAVQFSSAGSNDPEGQALTYYWNFGDGNSSTDANPSHTFTTAGVYNVRLTVTDQTNLASSATVQVSAGNAAPTGQILTPLVSDEYRVNQTVAFSGSGTDPEDGAIPSQNITWDILMHHCEVITNTCHVHPFLTATGANGSFIAPDHGAGSYFEIRMSVRDANGLITTTSRELHPEEVALTLNSDPLRATVVINGTELVTPVTVNVIVNSEQTLFTPTTQTIEDVEYTFASWSNGNAQNHTFTVGEEPMTVTANYTTEGESTQKIWHSYDAALNATTPQATIADTTGETDAELRFYESTNDNGVTQSALLNTYRTTAHPEGFNDLSTYWARVPGTFGEYPYVGKNAIARSQSGGETNAPLPQGVFDMQMSPPENEHLVVSAFIVPEDGTYAVSNLAARRVLGWGGTTTLKVFNPAQTQVAAVTTSSTAWTTDSESYDLGELSEGDVIYFAVDRDGDFVGDATEIAWTVTKSDDEPEIAEPTIDTFTASPSAILAGEETTLAWTTTNATAVTIDNGVGTVALDGSETVSPEETTTYTLTATRGSETMTETVTVTVGAAAGPLVWNSYKAEVLDTGSRLRVTAENSSASATLEVYESTNDNGVEQGSLLNTYRNAAHPEGFNALSSFWTNIPGSFGEYPYVGKNATDRGTDGGETNTPSPTNVRDMQMSPPENEHLIVAAFIVPENGTYTISNLGTRRVLGWGGTTSFKVFNSQRAEIATLQATGLPWVTNTQSYNVGTLTAGDKIYFSVDRDGDFVGDATEVAWTITKQ